MSETAADPFDLAAMRRYRRAVNYLAAAQIYLRGNGLLQEPLRPAHIKPRLLGHWGTAPGINLLYQHLNRLICETDASVLMITGPGHGAAANLANMYLEGTLAEYFPDMTRDAAGLERFLRAFSWPDGFPSHLVPAYPGVIHEGGELGYALATAFGAAFDNPDLLVACLVGDGEAETGPTAGAWHSAKFLNAATDGAVLPVLHLNDYKIANPTLFASMDDDELTALFTGYGYRPRIVSLRDGADIDVDLHAALRGAHDEIRNLQEKARASSAPAKPYWPMLVLRTPKGWTGPENVDGKAIEGSFRAHQVPVKDPAHNPQHLRMLEDWLRSYRPDELFDADGQPAQDLLAQCPPHGRRIALNPHADGGARRVALDLPPLEEHAVVLDRRGGDPLSGMDRLGGYLSDLTRRNADARNFRMFCPDELESNRLGAVLDVTARQYNWPVPANAEHIGADGRVMEVLSEHNCQGWMQGYLLTGRHGVFPCYEAFLPIVDGMMNQYAKFLKTAIEVPWRRPISSLNYLLTSEAWRQEHNGYSHQGPGFINNLLTKKGHTYRIYFPPDANCLLHTVDRCLRVTDQIHVVIAGKQPMPQWLGLDEAREHCRVGASTWRWASTHEGEDPQVVLAGCGDSVTLEVMAAADLLRQHAPHWRVRVVNITDLLVLGIPQKYPHGLPRDRFERLFPRDVPVVFNFHGYTAAVKQLCWERHDNARFDINGYREEGTTTTPFDMHIRNRTSRYHLVMQAAQKIAAGDPTQAALAEELIVTYEGRIAEHQRYIRAEGKDPDEIAAWSWSY